MWSSIFAVLFLLSLNPVHAQAINPDLVVWTTINQWADLRGCVRICLGGSGAGIGFPSIQGQVQCDTNACLCRPDILGSAEQSLSSVVSQQCSDIQDISTATSILTSYCSAKGYTSVIAPTILGTTGACTQAPTATVTAYVTHYVTLSMATCKSYQHQAVKGAVAAFSVLLLHQIGVF
jgi:hypothetical protein